MTIYRKKARSSTGVTAFIAVLLILLAIIVVGAISLVFNIGMCTYYQAKVNYVADQAAHYAAGRYCWYQNINPAGMGAVRTSTQVMVSRELSDMGMPAGTVTVSLNGSQMQSNVQVSGLILPGHGNLPGAINLQGSGSADLDADMPAALMLCTFQNDPTHDAVVCPSWAWYVEASTDFCVRPPPLPDVNVERDWGNLYFGMAVDVPNGTAFITADPKPPGVP